MSFVSRFDDFQRRHPKAGYPLAVVYKFFDDQGGYLAALITYYGFLSLFPLLLLFTTVLGIVLQHHQGLKDEIIHKTLEYIPVVGEQLQEPQGIHGNTVAIVIGLIGAVYGGLGVSVAVQNAMNAVWAVPRNSRPNPIVVRVRGFGMLITVGVTLVLLVGISIVTSAMNLGGDTGRFLTVLGSGILLLIVFIAAFQFGTAREVSVADVFPGALVATVGWQVLQHFGGYYVQHVVARTDHVNSVFAAVLGLIAFICLAAVLIVFALEINAVRVDKLYPRALLTEFTDDVDLQRGDVRTYTRLAQAQRNKGFETIDVSFDNPRDRTDDQETESDPPT
ncbi:MAG: YihY/virulence factor BrkB family protein [Gordonia sp. (in: high G+C Gram-positive bacteria)]|uniref:YihY/virulence factor BrkB family protein n=1 Tax=Gordonia sp. (in: high G+C Gram-positive bacteria) TaxID=84139 RepID=UPI0039E2CE90